LNFGVKSAILGENSRRDDKMAFDREKIKQKIAEINEKIGGEADPRLLNEYRVLFKKGISFFRRSWAAAYLLMLYDLGQGAGNSRKESGSRSRAGPSLEGEGKKSPRRAEGSGKRDGGETSGRTAAPRPFLAEEESRRLFISIGRNRRVFPREILGLILTRAQVAREDIGMMRILDSYSFVQVRDTAADAVIEALNGTTFRGKTITANYARLKREEGQGEDGAEEVDAAPGDADSLEAGPADAEVAVDPSDTEVDAEPVDAGPAGAEPAGDESADIDAADDESADSYIDEIPPLDETRPDAPYLDGRAESESEAEDYFQSPEDGGGYDGLEHDDDLGDKEGV
jgi:hypothetical protein